jgi:hypothetical protein
MLTAIVVILFALTAALDWLPEIKNRPKKETVVYGLLWTSALAVLLLFSFGVRLPSPNDAIKTVFGAIFNVD